MNPKKLIGFLLSIALLVFLLDNLDLFVIKSEKSENEIVSGSFNQTTTQDVEQLDIQVYSVEKNDNVFTIEIENTDNIGGDVTVMLDCNKKENLTQFVSPGEVSLYIFNDAECDKYTIFAPIE